MIVRSIAHRRMPLQKLDDLRTGKRFIFEQTVGKGFEVLTLFNDDLPCLGKACFN